MLWKMPSGRKVHVDDLGQRLADHRQKDPLARLAEVDVLLRRNADDRREVGRLLPHRDARQMEHRKIVGERIEAGVIAERPFAAPLARLDVAFEHDVRARRHLEIDRDRLHQLDAPAAEKPGEQQLVEPFGHRRRRRIREDRLGAQRHRHLEPLAQPLGDAMVLRAALVPLPVHAGRAAVEHLHPVRADVAHAGFRILRDDERQRDVAAAVLGPASSESAARRASRRA